tara:strand:+ start:171 stop:311 length:141 start_codon:yes stop_codon:yes gene_type:complete
MSNPLSFKAWCELNGKRWDNHRSYEEFERNFKDYETYRKSLEPKTK